MADQSEKR